MDILWAGWRSTTPEMQAHGWEFAVERDVYDQAYNVLMRHREGGWTGMGRAFIAELMDASYRYRSPMRSNPTIQVQRMAGTDRMISMYVQTLPVFARVDMQPELALTSRETTIDELGIFKPWAPKAQEIIVEPATVASLLEQIKRAQVGDLAEIRERNRKRELRDQHSERVVAQVISLAA
jgi:hypothetical protein